MKRRDFLKTMGIGAAGMAVAPSLMAASTSPLSPEDPDIFNPDSDAKGDLNDENLGIRPLKANINKPITVIIIGAGNRGYAYSKYVKKFPELVKIVGVCDMNDFRRNRMATEHNIPAENQYKDFHDILSRPKFADAAVIALPDFLHFEPCMKALEIGYDVLLEKPMAPTAKECRALLAQKKKTGRILATCHVLRYAPYFIALKEVLRQGVIGDVVSIQHMEPIRYEHMAHSYVRGNWHDSKKTTPIILAKSCHDLDIVRWLVDKPCESIVADGGLYLFKKENAPQGAPLRCTDGCPHEDSCPYSAIDIYARKKRHTYVFDGLDKNDYNAVLERLRTTDYGKCVYHCDNDQPDHYICGMLFQDGVTCSFTMDAFTPHGGRRTRIMGTKGFIDGDMSSFCITDFRTGRKKRWNMKVTDIPEYKGAGHGGGDLALFRDFVEAVSWQDEGKLSSSVDVSIESHLMGFAAERSRKSGRKEKIK